MLYVDSLVLADRPMTEMETITWGKGWWPPDTMVSDTVFSQMQLEPSCFVLGFISWK